MLVAMMGFKPLCCLRGLIRAMVMWGMNGLLQGQKRRGAPLLNHVYLFRLLNFLIKVLIKLLNVCLNFIQLW